MWSFYLVQGYSDVVKEIKAQQLIGSGSILRVELEHLHQNIEQHRVTLGEHLGQLLCSLALCKLKCLLTVVLFILIGQESKVYFGVYV